MARSGSGGAVGHLLRLPTGDAAAYLRDMPPDELQAVALHLLQSVQHCPHCTEKLAGLDESFNDESRRGGAGGRGLARALWDFQPHMPGDRLDASDDLLAQSSERSVVLASAGPLEVSPSERRRGGPLAPPPVTAPAVAPARKDRPLDVPYYTGRPMTEDAFARGTGPPLLPATFASAFERTSPPTRPAVVPRPRVDADPFDLPRRAQSGTPAMIPLRQLRYYQDTVNARFSDGRGLADTIADLRSGAISVASIPPLRVLRRLPDGMLFSLSNRRLTCYLVVFGETEPDKLIPCLIHEEDESTCRPMGNVDGTSVYVIGGLLLGNRYVSTVHVVGAKP